ncbi:MAG: EF-P beta-lysylation protein EpmB [Planctomycetota bacterium]
MTENSWLSGQERDSGRTARPLRAEKEAVSYRRLSTKTGIMGEIFRVDLHADAGFADGSTSAHIGSALDRSHLNSALQIPSPTGSHWKQSLGDAIRDIDTLLDALGLPRELATGARAAAVRFPLVVPRDYLQRMRRGDASDPLLRQVLPLDAELVEAPEFRADPVGDLAAGLEAGVLKKYDGRVLLIASGTCAVNCRFCFRREYPYASAPHSLAAWRRALEQVDADGTIREVILSGGDPLVLPDSLLAGLAREIAAIPHVRRLRIHTRLPIVLPDRVTPELVSSIASTRLRPIVVVHANHPNELVGACVEALRALVAAGFTVLNQAVLLAGVNDDADTLVELCERLIDLRVLPYYLHQLDKVRGAAHFEVPEARGLEIVAELRRRLPGYAVPRYVREDEGASSKTAIIERE